jgi:SM-20-related protein
LRVSDDPAERARSDDPLARFAAWWSSEPVLAFLREITGLVRIAFADAQATAYSPGDFLTGHDDDVTGKNRLAAYVLNLTPRWRTEWGGLLAFHDDSSPEVIALSPAFNRLNLFKVPRRHSVTR